MVQNKNLPGEELKIATLGLKRDFPDGIPACGTDALRLGLFNDEVKIQQVNLDVNIFKASRNFCNKMWQAVRLLMLYADQHGVHLSNSAQLKVHHLEDAWILGRCAKTIAQANRHLETNDFHHLVRDIKTFVKSDICDVYIEAIKPTLQNKDTEASPPATAVSQLSILCLCLDIGLKLLHPVMPFITEELYQHLRLRMNLQPESIMLQKYPTSEEVSSTL